MSRRFRKTAACPKCCPQSGQTQRGGPQGGAIFEATYDYSGDHAVPVWECCNCWHRMPRRTPKEHRERQTSAQDRMVARLKQRIADRHCHGNPDSHEFKRYEANYDPQCGLVFLTSEYGRIGDEGTLGAVYCRDYRHIAIGRHGGVKLLNAKDGQPRGLFDVINSSTR